jgi:hypothetical protein
VQRAITSLPTGHGYRTRIDTDGGTVAEAAQPDHRCHRMGHGSKLRHDGKTSRLLDEAHGLLDSAGLRNNHLRGVTKRRRSAVPVTKRGLGHDVGDGLALVAVKSLSQADIEVEQETHSRLSTKQIGDDWAVMPRRQDALQHDMESGIEGRLRAIAQHAPARSPIVVPALQDYAAKIVLLQDRCLIRALPGQLGGNGRLASCRWAAQHNQPGITSCAVTTGLVRPGPARVAHEGQTGTIRCGRRLTLPGRELATWAAEAATAPSAVTAERTSR